MCSANATPPVAPVAVRVFTYLPNPRLWKAQIAARIAGVGVEVRGAPPRELPQWLWDFNAQPLAELEPERYEGCARTGHTGFKSTLYKTDAFLSAHPWGTVPAGFSPDGEVGVFESNSIMRAVARAAPASGLYGADIWQASRIDSFLDASLNFARDAQHYLLGLGSGEVSVELHERMAQTYRVYCNGVQQALGDGRAYLLGAQLTLADICFACELALFSREVLACRKAQFTTGGAPPAIAPELLDPIAAVNGANALVYAHFERLLQHPAFAPDMLPYMRKNSVPAQGAST